MFPKTNDRYRKSYLAADIKQANLGVWILLLPLTVFLVNDYLFFALNTEFYFLTILRIGFIAYSIMFIVYLGKIKTIRQYYISEFIWGLIGIGLQLTINASRPQGSIFHVIMVIVIIFVTCLVIPQTFVNRAILSLMLTIIELAIVVIGLPTLAITGLFTIVFSLALANIIGLSMSRLMDSYRVKAFINQEKLVESEKKYHDFADSLPEIAFEADATGKILFVNKNASKVLGYSEEEFKQKNIIDFIAPEYRQNLKENFQNAMQGKKSRRNEYRILTKDGSTFPAITFSEKTVDKEGISGLRGLVVNVSEQKIVERTLKDLNEKLRVSGSMTRHDVRNKFSIITGYTYLLKKKHADQADIVDGLGKVEQAVLAAGRIFEFAKLYEQLGVEELKYVDVQQTVDEAVALFPALPFKVVNGCSGLRVFADSIIRQLFYNLIDNTKKYGEKTSAIKVYFEKAESNELQLTYEDDGVGISAENKLKLFTEGFSTGGSTGFGLFLIKKMIEVYGWTITETSESGKGAKFTIAIPKFNKNGKENFQIRQ